MADAPPLITIRRLITEFAVVIGFLLGTGLVEYIKLHMDGMSRLDQWIFLLLEAIFFLLFVSALVRSLREVWGEVSALISDIRTSAAWPPLKKALLGFGRAVLPALIVVARGAKIVLFVVVVDLLVEVTCEILGWNHGFAYLITPEVPRLDPTLMLAAAAFLATFSIVLVVTAIMLRRIRAKVG